MSRYKMIFPNKMFANENDLKAYCLAVIDHRIITENTSIHNLVTQYFQKTHIRRNL